MGKGTNPEKVVRTVVETVQHPDRIRSALAALRSIIEVARFDSHSPLKDAAGRARRLSGLQLPSTPSANRCSR